MSVLSQKRRGEEKIHVGYGQKRRGESFTTSFLTLTDIVCVFFFLRNRLN